jgi:hypothetical protein
MQVVASIPESARRYWNFLDGTGMFLKVPELNALGGSRIFWNFLEGSGWIWNLLEGSGRFQN